MTIQTLEHTSIDEITEVFNRSFADYLVPFKLTQEQLIGKMNAENIHLAFSVGAFEGNQLVGFMLHGMDPGQKIAYNGGTGVLPEQRGKRLTQQMYGHLVPLLQQAHFVKIQLEVISENHKAYKSYKTVGFRQVRELICFKGTINPVQTSSPFEVKPLERQDWAILEDFWDWQPTWQNDGNAMRNSKDRIQSLGIFTQNKPVAYAVFNPTSKRIHQFAVHKNHRCQGLGRQLFSAVSEALPSECSLINIDSAAAPTLSFLSSMGLNPFLKQYEMVLMLETNT